jgi:hypothetical protein
MVKMMMIIMSENDKERTHLDSDHDDADIMIGHCRKK